MNEAGQSRSHTTRNETKPIDIIQVLALTRKGQRALARYNTRMGPLPHLIPCASALCRGLLLALLLVSTSAAAGAGDSQRTMQVADSGSGDGAPVPRNHSQPGNRTTHRGQRAHHRVRPLPFCMNMAVGLPPAEAARLRDLLQVAQHAVTEVDEARQMLEHNKHKGDQPEAGEG